MASATEGDATELFRTEYGWHILEVKLRDDKDFSGEIQRNQVANYIREQKYQEELDAWLRKIREEAFADIMMKTSCHPKSRAYDRQNRSHVG